MKNERWRLLPPLLHPVPISECRASRKWKSIFTYEDRDICFLHPTDYYLSTAILCIFPIAAYVFTMRKLKCQVQVEYMAIFLPDPTHASAGVEAGGGGGYGSVLVLSCANWQLQLVQCEIEGQPVPGSNMCIDKQEVSSESKSVMRGDYGRTMNIQASFQTDCYMLVSCHGSPFVLRMPTAMCSIPCRWRTQLCLSLFFNKAKLC